MILTPNNNKHRPLIPMPNKRPLLIRMLSSKGKLMVNSRMITMLSNNHLLMASSRTITMPSSSLPTELSSNRLTIRMLRVAPLTVRKTMPI